MRSGGLVEDLVTAKAVQLLAAVLASAAAAWFIGSGDTRTLAFAGIGLLVFAALMRWPALTLVTLLIICQELDPGAGFAGSGSSLLFLGHQLYYTTTARVSLLTIAVVITAARVAISMRPSRPRRGAVLVMAALGVWYTALVWAGGASLKSAINQDSRFSILFLACFVIGLGASSSRSWRKNAVPVLVWVISGMALLGLYLTATGQGQAQAGANLIFYDSALGAIAGALVLAVVSTPAASRSARIWWLGGASLVVVVLSSRRNVWAAMIVALLVTLMFGRNRIRLVIRVLGGISIVLVALAVLRPSVLGEIGHQLSAIWGATQGSASDTSAQGHLTDVSVGWHAVTASPISGVGPSGRVAGLVVEGGGPLYIHNQVLESWLRFGIVGAVLIVILQIVLVVEGIRTIKRPTSAFTDVWAAELLVMAPVAMLTAPFLTTTQRWPAILGFAAGLVASRRSSEAPWAAAASDAPGALDAPSAYAG